MMADANSVNGAKHVDDDDDSMEWKNCKLYWALKNPQCSANKIKQILKSEADVNCEDDDGKTLLHHIATIPFCDWEAINIILKSGAKVNARDEENNTPLHIAARHSDGNFSFIHELLHYGSEVNARNDDGSTPLHLAAGSFCRWNVIKKLVDAGAKVNARDYAGNTPLHVAIEYSRSNTAFALLHSGADVNMKNGFGSTPLHRALKLLPQGYIVGEILNAGASVNDRDGEGYTPLHIAVAKGSSSATKLIKMGAIVGALDHSGDKPRQYVRHPICHLGPILDSAESEVLMKLSNSDLCLHSVMRSSDCDIHVIKPLTSEIDVNTQDIDGMTPLHLALKNPRCNTKIIEVLVKCGGCVNAVDLEGNCPLHYAVQRTTINLPIVDALLEYGAKVGLRNRFGDNVLYCALKNDSIEREELLTCFRMLIKFALLQNEFLSIEFCMQLIFKFPELLPYQSKCLAERKRMEKIVVHNNMSMFAFVVGRDDHLKSQGEKVFQLLLTNSFPIYVDVILFNIEKKYFVEKILTQEVYAAYDQPFKKNRVVLKSDCVRYLADFLPKLDLLNYFIAFVH